MWHIWQEETIKLLDLWSEESVQALLEGCIRNKIVYDKLAEDMATPNPKGQCQERIKKLKIVGVLHKWVYVVQCRNVWSVPSIVDINKKSGLAHTSFQSNPAQKMCSAQHNPTNV